MSATFYILDSKYLLLLHNFKKHGTKEATLTYPGRSENRSK